MSHKITIQSGVDLVEIAVLQQQLMVAGVNSLNKYFHAEESQGKSIYSLAGLFAAKEALLKTGLVGAGEWLRIKILPEASGKPLVYLSDGGEFLLQENLSISISHTDNYAIAVAFYLGK